MKSPNPSKCRFQPLTPPFLLLFFALNTFSVQPAFALSYLHWGGSAAQLGAAGQEKVWLAGPPWGLGSLRLKRTLAHYCVLFELNKNGRSRHTHILLDGGGGLGAPEHEEAHGGAVKHGGVHVPRGRHRPLPGKGKGQAAPLIWGHCNGLKTLRWLSSQQGGDIQ